MSADPSRSIEGNGLYLQFHSPKSNHFQTSPDLTLFPIAGIALICRFPDTSLQLMIEAMGLQKFFQRQVHPVAPLVVGIGRDIDPFVVRVFAAVDAPSMPSKS